MDELGDHTILVHAYDNEPCEQSQLHHGDPVCVHGYQIIEVWAPPDHT